MSWNCNGASQADTSDSSASLLVRNVLIVVGQPDFRTSAFHVEEGVFVMVAIRLGTVRNIGTIP